MHPGFPTEYRWILVGFDGSASASAALEMAVEEAGLNRALLGVWAVVGSPRLGVAAESDNYPSGLAELRAAAAQIAAETGAEFRVGRCGPAAVRCESCNASDLLVVGRRGRGLSQRVLGSVAEHVVGEARLPVLAAHSTGAQPGLPGSETRDDVV